MTSPNDDAREITPEIDKALHNALRQSTETIGMISTASNHAELTAETDRLNDWCVEATASVAELEFNRGYLSAVSNLVNLHDHPVIAADVLGELGIKQSYLRKLDLTDYDRKALNKAFAELNRRSPRTSHR